MKSVTKLRVIRDRNGRFAAPDELPVNVVDGNEFLNDPSPAKPKRKRRPTAAVGIAPQLKLQSTASATNIPAVPGIVPGSGSDMWPSLVNYAPSKCEPVIVNNFHGNPLT